MKLKRIWSREILDSRGIPTIECYAQDENGSYTSASVPAGTSMGGHEALELRDADPARYNGQGVLKAINNINTILNSLLMANDYSNLEEVDKKIINADGSTNKSKLGGNAILAVSTAICKLLAINQNKPLYTVINQILESLGYKTEIRIPTALFNMINGGLHGAGNLDFQEFWVIPASNKTFSQGLQMGAEIYHSIGQNLARRGAIHSVGHEGGYAPNLFTNADAFEVFVESVKQTNYTLGRDLFLGLDIAANSFYKNGDYVIRDRSTNLDDDQLLEYYKELSANYKLAILEDAFHEDAWNSWKKLYSEMSGNSLIAGDDLLVTNPERVKKAIEEKVCNAAIIKPNQIGTISEALKVVKMVKDAGWKVITSHRSGETNDSFIADFAVGIGSDYAKFGAPARGERVSKYNRLSAIEMELKQQK